MTALLALLPFALATQVTWDSAPCPVGDANARVFYKASGNTHGGWDSDLANYSTQGQWREYAISTCPDTLYSVYGFDMDKPLDDATAAAVTARLDALRKQYKLDAETIETWERYLVAGEVYKVLKKDPRFLAQLYLEASWAARDMAVGVYVGLEGPVAARELLDQGEKELLRQLPPRERKVLLHNLARVAHRGGFNADRDRYLKLFEQVGDLDADEQAALDTFRRVADTIEPQLQRLAVEQLKAYLASDPDDPVEVARATYLLADLARRLDQPRQAAQGYALVLTMSEAPPELRELSAFLGSLLDGEAP
ncbi:MAG: hypothetical protein H6739_33580 [Alphaproteobacteria bacterium]|nr:hypothetical protein [Alphaproteobacteria bacterium]